MISAHVTTLLAGATTAMMLFSSQPRLKERSLADVGVIGIPRNLDSDRKNEAEGGLWDEEIGRLSFGYSNTYFWASMGSITAYKEQLIVSMMAPDATAAEYTHVPRRMSISYDGRRKVRDATLGSGTLTVYEGMYSVGSLNEPALQFVYSDRARRLQLVWHAVKKEVDLETGTKQIGLIASSFKITRDPVAKFATMRGAPRKEEEQRARNLAAAKAMLQREGYAALEPGKPVLRNGVYFEWMIDPEPRYQLLVPLGRVRGPESGSVVGRPRPLAAAAPKAGSISWREMQDGEWVFTNDSRSYLPMDGLKALLASQQQEPGYVYFYYIGTVRIHEEPSEASFTTLRWFLDNVPDVQRRWSEGTLVGPGKPEKD